MSKGHGGGRRVVIAALAGNAGIAVAKFIAAGLTGSAAMLAEAVHSLADTCNQILLLTGMTLAKKQDPDRYPLGRGKEVYFWAFVVSLLLFFGGGVHAIYEGVEKLRNGHGEVGSAVPSLIVLGISIALEASSFSVAWREFRGSRAGRTVWEALFGGKDPTVAIVLLEDTGAILGLLIALVSVVVTWTTHSPVADAVGSIAIGALLCAVGAALARDTHSLLLGEAASPEVWHRARELVEGTEGVEKVTQMLTMHLGPEAILLALKVRFRPGMTVEEVERVTDDLEERVRAKLPQMHRIFVEADSHYDETRDPGMSPRADR